MTGVNKVILVGHLGKDPEMRYLENDRTKASFTLATNDSYKNKETDENAEPLVSLILYPPYNVFCLGGA